MAGDDTAVVGAVADGGGGGGGGGDGRYRLDHRAELPKR